MQKLQEGDELQVCRSREWAAPPTSPPERERNRSTLCLGELGHSDFTDEIYSTTLNMQVIKMIRFPDHDQCSELLNSSTEYCPDFCLIRQLALLAHSWKFWVQICLSEWICMFFSVYFLPQSKLGLV